MVNQVEKNTDRFTVVGPGCQICEIPKRKLPVREKLKGKPVFSVIILSLIILGCVFAPVFANHDPTKFYLNWRNTAPNSEFYFGTDSLGRDLYSIMFYGGRTSLTIGILGAAIITVIGTIYGCVSGMVSEQADAVLMRIAETCGCIPTILLVLIFSEIFEAKNTVTLSFVIGITGWFGMARIVRGEVRKIRNFEYVLYARYTGGKFLYIMWRHLIPNFLSAIMFVIVSNISTCITTESMLSFLGLGLPVDKLSWGSMLSLANRALIMNTWWVIIIPGLFLVITLICITNVGHYLRKQANRRSGNL